MAHPARPPGRPAWSRSGRSRLRRLGLAARASTAHEPGRSLPHPVSRQRPRAGRHRFRDSGHSTCTGRLHSWPCDQRKRAGSGGPPASAAISGGLRCSLFCPHWSADRSEPATFGALDSFFCRPDHRVQGRDGCSAGPECPACVSATRSWQWASARLGNSASCCRRWQALPGSSRGHCTLLSWPLSRSPSQRQRYWSAWGTPGRLRISRRCETLRSLPALRRWTRFPAGTAKPGRVARLAYGAVRDPSARPGNPSGRARETRRESERRSAHLAPPCSPGSGPD